MIKEIIKINNIYYYNKVGAWHNKNRPAIEKEDGSKQWYKDGEEHRLDGPAFKNANGNECWFKEGNRNRADGPACEHSDGNKIWWLDDIQILKEDFNNWIKRIRYIYE